MMKAPGFREIVAMQGAKRGEVDHLAGFAMPRGGDSREKFSREFAG